MFDNKIKRKLENLLKNVEPEKISQLSEMIKSGENIEKNIDFEKASSLIKSLNLENEITPEMISQGFNKLKENPDILSQFGKKEWL